MRSFFTVLRLFPYLEYPFYPNFYLGKFRPDNDILRRICLHEPRLQTVVAPRPESGETAESAADGHSVPGILIRIGEKTVAVVRGADSERSDEY
jgi:hypothetical protein